ncbi:CRAL/TRIO domain-containing protein [Pisolithus thermaeus]|nr:CRAL/TRIO domain-containing protein [Pisolithus croceorrhizus]KAI6166662.1 CRAL/TRIO domain-containing protein [Pisolithus thermaeus]
MTGQSSVAAHSDQGQNGVGDPVLEAFKGKLASDGLYRPPAHHCAQASHDDTTLMRFLRARQYDITNAQKQFADSEAWRKRYDVDNLYKDFSVDEMESARRFYPRWTGRRDKRGLPVYVFRLASLDESLRKELDALSPERRYQRIIVLHETMTRFVLPFCDYLPHEPPTPVSSVVTIIDLGNVSLSAMWALRTHLQQASTMATAYYPETLDTTVVINSPAFFSTIWGWIKGWFDEGTRRKIHVLGKSPSDFLRHLIAAEDLPTVYGGDLPWIFEDEPCLDSEALKVVKEMPKGPVAFVAGQGVITLT